VVARAVIEPSSAGIRVEIPTQLKAWQKAVHGVLLGSTVVGAAWAVAGGQTLFLISCSLTFVVWLAALAQQLFGKEVIRADEQELVLETATWPWRYRRRFERDRIERMRAEPAQQGAGEIRAFAIGAVAFDYEDRTYRFGAELGEDESRRLVELLAKELGLKPPAVEPERPVPF
jgi:hypothetical protein